MAQTASRETQEEIGVRVDPECLQFLFADAIFGEKDYWVECFVTKSPSAALVQMEEGIAVKWISWNDFSKNNAFKEYNTAVHCAYQAWTECQRTGTTYRADLTHLDVNTAAPYF